MRTVLAGGRVFDGTGAPIADADVLFEDGRIVEVGPGLDGDERVGVSGRTLLPGMFDCHTHVMFSHIDFLKMMEEPFSQMYFEAANNLRATLGIGITTIRDAGGADLGVKTAVEKSLTPGPRMQISLAMISQTGGHGDGWLPTGAQFPFPPDWPGMPSSIVDGPQEMRRKIR